MEILLGYLRQFHFALKKFQDLMDGRWPCQGQFLLRNVLASVVVRNIGSCYIYLFVFKLDASDSAQTRWLVVPANCERCGLSGVVDCFGLFFKLLILGLPWKSSSVLTHLSLAGLWSSCRTDPRCSPLCAKLFCTFLRGEGIY